MSEVWVGTKPVIRPVWAEIDLDAIAANLAAIKTRLAPETKVMAIVKANAYGHGLIPVARKARQAGADRLGVALVEEALELREAGLDIPIHILSEPPVGAAEEIAAYHLIPAVYSIELAQALSRKAQAIQAPITVHLKVDTGMHRVGAPLDRSLELYQAIRRLPGLKVEGIFTHFACADNPQDPFTAKQLQSFLRLKKALPEVPMWHAANSAATIFMPETQLDMVRIGIAMYGLQPSTKPSPIPLKPALSLRTKISFVQELQSGEGVSYGLTYVAERKITVATLPIGYGDGYSRLLSNKGKVLLGGKRVNIIGNICMDQLLVKVDNVKAAAGDEVVLIGNQGKETISAEEMASWLGTINYEVVCLINTRVARVYQK
ncbi:MAG: alanine racemase [Actinomycetota bacterium]|nr:alanine racemase [Actinomycetota bacterium]